MDTSFMVELRRGLLHLLGLVEKVLVNRGVLVWCSKCLKNHGERSVCKPSIR